MISASLFLPLLYSISCNSHSLNASFSSFPESVKYRNADSIILFIPQNTRICSSEYTSDFCIRRSRIFFRLCKNIFFACRHHFHKKFVIFILNSIPKVLCHPYSSYNRISSISSSVNSASSLRRQTILYPIVSPAYKTRRMTVADCVTF